MTQFLLILLLIIAFGADSGPAEPLTQQDKIALLGAGVLLVLLFPAFIRRLFRNG